MAENEWPVDVCPPIDTTEEMKRHLLHIGTVDEVVEVKRFSKWNRIVRTTAFVLRFIENLKSRVRGQDVQSGELIQEEIIKAEHVLYRQAQRSAYAEEIDMLKNNKPLSKASPIYKKSPYLDDNNILRIDGRIDMACITSEQKRPIILPKENMITTLIIMHYHNLYRHLNHETAVNEVRQFYYIPRLRVVFKKQIRNCQMCKIQKAVPQMPQMAKLPRARLAAHVAPFTFTGLDFFGPILITINQHKEKRYGVLFTCLTIRAVHIEIAYSLNTNSCILAIRNFIARRGIPREFFSDNGTNFIGAERELRQAVAEVNRNELVRTFTSSHTKWNFNPPLAPHMGGAWERLVRSIKNVFYKITPTRSPNEELLRSMMAEIENIINSRPLTYVPLDNSDAEAITPNHLLLGSSSGMKPYALLDDSAVVLK
ncbi:uncharacterized protein LOC118757462, partial [Rhagoletis pomonella]|uniref:uncharacterized protein LOC118757462 n=1 Tax=Rhagoletis pomonella TaxID=28610 RepID=UPI00177CC529